MRATCEYSDCRTLPGAASPQTRSISYDHSDVLVAFRVVRKDFDGSVVLLWKILKKYSKPGLQRSVAANGQ